MRDCHRPNWIVQKVTDFLLNRQFPEEMQNLRDLEKDLLNSANYEKKKELIANLTEQYLRGGLLKVDTLADALSIKSREELAPKFRKDFREIQINHRDVVFSKLDRLARLNTNEPLKGQDKTEFMQGIRLLSGCLDNPDVRSRVIDYLADCNLPLQCRQVIFQSFRGYRYQDIEEAVVKDFKSLLRNSKSSWGDMSFLSNVAGILLESKIAGRYPEEESPLVKYFLNVIDYLPKYQRVNERSQKFIILACDLITKLPLEKSLCGDELVLGTLGHRLVQNIRKSGMGLEASRELGLRVCNQFLENVLGLPSRATKSIKINIEGAVSLLNKSYKPS